MPLKEAASVLAKNHINALPVPDPDERLIGMVSERDLLAKQAHPLPERARWWQRRRTRKEIRRAEADTVRHVMTTDPVTIAPNIPLAEAARRMTDHELKHLRGRHRRRTRSTRDPKQHNQPTTTRRRHDGVQALDCDHHHR
jgi:CBS domain-containing protein